uniref:Uncharacterized protein n=1 Tax=Vitis vinifera TaxID=29760 RepID=A5BW16_VITVI|nr:hypothetical protein VITISV_043070 [Vitis vinifera]
MADQADGVIAGNRFGIVVIASCLCAGDADARPKIEDVVQIWRRLKMQMQSFPPKLNHMMQNGGELVRDIEMKKLMVRVNEDPFVHDDQESSGGDPHSFVKVVLDDLMRIRTRKSSCKCELRSQKMEISVQT